MTIPDYSCFVCIFTVVTVESGFLVGIITVPPSPFIRSLCPVTAGGHGVLDPKFQGTGHASELAQLYVAAGMKVV